MDELKFPLWDLVLSEVGPPPEGWQEGARTVVALRGEQDMSTAARVAGALAEMCAVGQDDVVVDLSQVLFMDAAIIGVLVAARNVLRSQSRELTIREPSRSARRLLELCGLVELVEPASAALAGENGSGATGRCILPRTPRRQGRAGTAQPWVAHRPAIPAPAVPIAKAV